MTLMGKWSGTVGPDSNPNSGENIVVPDGPDYQLLFSLMASLGIAAGVAAFVLLAPEILAAAGIDLAGTAAVDAAPEVADVAGAAVNYSRSFILDVLDNPWEYSAKTVQNVLDNYPDIVADYDAGKL